MVLENKQKGILENHNYQRRVIKAPNLEIIYRLCIIGTVYTIILDSFCRNYFFPKTEGLISKEKKKPNQSYINTRK